MTSWAHSSASFTSSSESMLGRVARFFTSEDNHRDALLPSDGVAEASRVQQIIFDALATAPQMRLGRDVYTTVLVEFAAHATRAVTQMLETTFAPHVTSATRPAYVSITYLNRTRESPAPPRICAVVAFTHVQYVVGDLDQ